ncbi:MAG: serine/threonine protein kinase [Colwellia sp.]|uniref:serine/threonine-protein kinase n=1 Tax=Colwellia sp. TaxID=56799 RepID=UPI001DC49F2C|nr:serine/threonine-protein kinase [Colwellia sp.]NQY49351.1 serine/threonine protein kinase [Colwellia sp.]
MVKRLLPIYHTGWFYLLLLFWGFSFCYVANGGLNQVNQLNINALAKLTSMQTLPGNNTTFDSNNILTLYSSFDDHELDSITTILSSHPQSQITLLAKPSSTFMSQLESYLASSPRYHKVIIASANSSSTQALNSQSSTLLARTLSWFRYSAEHKIKKINSTHFIYTPFLINERQSLPIIWQQQDGIYLSLAGEILKQLSVNNELSLNQNWQLSLSNKENSLIPTELSLGFFGDVFTSGDVVQVSQENSAKLDRLSNPEDIASNAVALTSVKHFIEQQDALDSATFSPRQYKAIIIIDDNYGHQKMVLPLVNKLIKGDYLSQNLSTVLLCWALAAIALILAWFIRHLHIKQQLIGIVSYSLVLFIIQYFMFKQQQWLEVLPVVLLLAGSWLLLFAYQKEFNLFLSALNYRTEHLPSASLATMVGKAAPLSNKQVKIAQSSSPAVKDVTVTKTNSARVASPVSTIAMPAEDFEQTLVIVDNPLQSQSKLNHHLTVKNFGRYQVEGILGKGAMGIVYQGVDPKINRHVAIKTLQLSDDIDSAEFTEAKERFFREAQTAGGLSHANIVTIYDVGEENKLGYIAMDLLTGAPLSLFIQPEKTLPIPLVYQLLIQITDALDYAHKQNVVHRDIKPANIIYDDDLLKVTVTDFGIAYVSDNSKTRTGIIMGSPYYMSPEQILGLKVDGRSDIFSLGVTFYQLLCGYLPFEGESIATVAYQITKAKAVAVNQRNPALPTSAQRICNKAMHKDIDKRYQNMAEFKLALANALKRDFKVSAL